MAILVRGNGSLSECRTPESGQRSSGDVGNHYLISSGVSVMRWFVLFSIFLYAFLVGSIAQAAEARTWTSGKHKIEAEFVKIDGDNVVLKSVKSGKILTVPISKFSPADQAYIQDLIKKAKADPLPKPADGDKKKSQGDKKKSKDDEDDDLSGGRPKGKRRPPKPAGDPSATLQDGQGGLVLPTEPSKWLRGNPITLNSIGNRAIVFVLFDEESTVNVRRWARWISTATKYKDKPILFIAVNSGNSRAEVKLAVQKYKIPWPTIVDSSRQFESHLHCRTVGRLYPYIIRVMNGKGTFYYGSLYSNEDAFETSIHTAMNGAKWQVNPKGMPGSLRKAWANIENARYHAAAADVGKGLDSKKSKIKKFAKKLDAKIADHFEGIVGEALYQEDQGNKFAALRIYNELLQEYAGYPLDKRIKKTADRMSKDPDIQGEIAAMDVFYAAKKIAVRSSASARRRGIAKLEKIVEDFPDTIASEEAAKLIERLE